MAGAPFPLELLYLWKIYNRLRRRQGGGFGVAPISWEAIDAFLRRSRSSVAPWEMEILEELDDLYLIAMSRKSAAT